MEKMTIFKSLFLCALMVFLAACSDSSGLFEESIAEGSSGSAGAVDSGTTLPQELVNTTLLVDAGADQSLQLPTTNVQVLAKISNGGERNPSMLTYEWTQVSGPGTAVMLPGTLSDGVLLTDITVDVEGAYVLRLTASDGELSSSDEVSVTLFSAPVGGGPMLNGISGYWRLDENGGTQAVNSINAAQSGTLLNLNESNWGPGVYNSGLCLDGEPAQQVSIVNAVPELTTESISLLGWVQVDDTFNSGAWIAGQGDNYGLHVGESGSLTFYYYGAGWENVSKSAPSLFDGGWHHVAGTFDEASRVIALYLDGVQLESKVAERSIRYEWGEGFSLGSKNGGRNFNGCLDEIQVYGRALSGTEVQQLYQR